MSLGSITGHPVAEERKQPFKGIKQLLLPESMKMGRGRC